MNHRLWNVTLLALLAPVVMAESPEEAPLIETCGPDPQYQFISHNVFDPTLPGYTWVHRFANQLHITTRPVTLENEVAGFTPCEEDVDDLYELERYLRARPYLRDAQVQEHTRSDGERLIEVQTWDTWSLLPTISFSREGGENSGSFGIKDSNFLGLGIDTELLYFSNYERTGYLLDLKTPLFLKQNLRLALTLADTDDGRQAAFSLTRPFVAKDTRYAWAVAMNDEKREDSIRQGNGQVNEYARAALQYRGWYGWSPGEQNDAVWRYQVGLSRDKMTFGAIEETVLVPQDRDQVVAWFRSHYQQDRFTERTNVFLINSYEDINLGLDIGLRVGWDTRNSNPQGDAQLAFGLDLHPNLLWLTKLAGEVEEREDGKTRLYGQWRQELFYRFSEPVRFYAKTVLTGSDNTYIDQPVTLGGDTGMRGYPLQYQHGDWHWLASAEARYYPSITLFQLAEMGAAMFYDVGRSYGGSPYPDNPEGALQSVGAGLRFYLSRAGSRNVVHLDFARPINDDPEVNRWEWRVEVRNHF
ncbi:hypothetical protein [Ferrimonas balearica]|uniref:hypothetical protein n=1 Tax=Ferrimonas balearica TaxID=44012 RepID=UPI001F2AF120|nr:hypothetical protein [Ferrimonas balearica]MBY6018299.1 hypothetical protein [Halomonas denitrificans]MBY6094639.1 hypothetical protein [Ferrimonas balearica]